MALPKTVPCFGLVLPVLRETKDGLDGLYCGITKTIWVDPSHDEELAEKTLSHEFIHAVIDRVGLNQVIDIEPQEVLCETVSTALYEAGFRWSNLHPNSDK